MRTCPQCHQSYTDDFESCPRHGTPLSPTVGSTRVVQLTEWAGKYRIIRRLGSGGFGEVFLAEQVRVGCRLVAVKILHRSLQSNPGFLSRFDNEAAATGRIRHPNVVTIYECAQTDDGSPYIAMEYLEGETLRDVLEKRGALPLLEAIEITRQVALGLDAAHKLGIIHRDLKPDNTFLTRDHEGRLLLKVVDFGIAKLRESATQTLTGTALGTPAYMSPEQAQGMRSDELDARSDLYSLGIVVYEMLTGSLPFHSDTPLGYLRKHLTEEPPPFQNTNPALAAQDRYGFLEKVVMKALRKNREERQVSVVGFAQDLANAQRADAHFRRGVELKECALNDLVEALSKLHSRSKIPITPARTPTKEDYNEAVAEFLECIQLMPNECGAHFQLAETFRLKGDLEEAVAEYREAVRLEPNDSYLRSRLGQVLVRDLGDLEGAIGVYREWARFEPNNLAAHCNLGHALEEKEDLKGALSEWQKAHELDPTNSVIRENYERVLGEVKQDPPAGQE